MLTKEAGEIDWKLPAEKIHNKIRAFVMGPGTVTNLKGTRVKIHKTKLASGFKGGKPGEIIENPEHLVIQTGHGALELLTVQPESRNRMSGQDFLKRG